MLGDDRLRFLDGLRGWGALVVLLAHVFGEGFPINAHVTAILARMGIFNAGLAVWVFFIVSGFSLSIGFCRRRDASTLTGIALGRHARLAIPILGASLLLYLFFTLDLVPVPEHRLPIFRTFLPTSPTLWDVIRFSLFDVFFAYDFATTLIPSLWTMPFEFWGSALVLGALFTVGRFNRRGWIYAALGVVAYLIHPIYAAFVVGLVLSEVHASGYVERNPGASRPVFLVLFLIGVFCAGLLPAEGGQYPAAYLLVACMLTAASVFAQPISRFLSGGFSRFLGRISFPLYLIHGPLFLAYGNNVYRWINSPSDIQKLLLNLSTVAVCIGCAVLLVPMDRFEVVAARRFGSYVMSQARVPKVSQEDLGASSADGTATRGRR